MLRSTVLAVAVVGTAAFNFTVVLPLLVRHTFRADASGLALLTSAMGLGSVAGALGVATLAAPSRRVLPASCLAFGVAAGLAALAPSLALEVPVLVVAGATSMAFLSTSNATLQLSADPSMRGRVMALYTLVFLGTTPIGGFLAGWVSELLSPRWSLAVGATGALAVGAFLTVTERARTARSGPSDASNPVPAAA